MDGLVALALGVLFYLLAKEFGLPLEMAILGFLAYVLLCDGMPGGQSVGKRFTKTAVVHAVTGEPCRSWQSVVRNLAMMLGLIDAVFILGKQRRRFGDYIARTQVVRREEVR